MEVNKYKSGDFVRIIEHEPSISEPRQVGRVVKVVNGYYGLIDIEFSEGGTVWCYKITQVETTEPSQTSSEERELLDQQIADLGKALRDCDKYETKLIDKVNPPHYKKGSVECIDAIKAATVGKSGFEGYLVGNVIKYLWREEDKGGVEDIKKANWYLNRLLDERAI